MKNIPTPILMGITALIVVLMASGAYLLDFKPTQNKIKKLEADIKSRESQISEATLKLKDYAPISEDEKLLWEQTEEQLLTIIPNKNHLHLLQGEIVNLGPLLNVVDMSYIPSKDDKAAANPTDPASGQGQIPSESEPAKSFQIDHLLLKMKFYCGYGELLDFLKGLNQLQRLVAIESLSVRKAIPRVMVDLTLRAYYWNT